MPAEPQITRADLDEIFRRAQQPVPLEQGGSGRGILGTSGNGLPRTTGLFYFDRMFNAWLVDRLLFIVESSLDVTVEVRLVGATDNAPRDPNRQFILGPYQSVSSVNRTSFPVALDGLGNVWHPWIGLEGNATTGPASGSISWQVYAVGRIGGYTIIAGR